MADKQTPDTSPDVTPIPAAVVEQIEEILHPPKTKPVAAFANAASVPPAVVKAVAAARKPLPNARGQRRVLKPMGVRPGCKCCGVKWPPPAFTGADDLRPPHAWMQIKGTSRFVFTAVCRLAGWPKGRTVTEAQYDAAINQASTASFR